MSHLWTDLLNGDEDVWGKFISETSINDVIDILVIDSESINPETHKSLKEELWFELACIAYVWGSPSLTKIGTSPTQMKAYAGQTKSDLLKSLSFLEKIQESPPSETWIKTKDITLAGVINNHMEESYNDSLCGEDLSEVIVKIRKIVSGIEAFEEKLSRDTKEQGKSKPSKDKHDELLRQLCTVYRRYTGQEPIAWNTGTSALNANQVIGDIIPFLQSVLSNTFYSGEISAEALQKRLYRMKASGKYQDIWPDNKE